LSRYLKGPLPRGFARYGLEFTIVVNKDSGNRSLVAMLPLTKGRPITTYSGVPVAHVKSMRPPRGGKAPCASTDWVIKCPDAEFGIDGAQVAACAGHLAALGRHEEVCFFTHEMGFGLAALCDSSHEVMRGRCGDAGGVRTCKTAWYADDKCITCVLVAARDIAAGEALLWPYITAPSSS
jgi:hypothetical protein